MTTSSRRRIHPAIRQRARELRQPQTPAEQRLWQSLRNYQLGGHYFRRQHPIGRFIVDFCCTRSKLVVEVDGEIHAFQANHDADRTECLAQRGYRVLRFSNDAIFDDLKHVVETIHRACDAPSGDEEGGGAL